MTAENERQERTAVAATGVSAAQADLSAPLTEHRSNPATVVAQGGDEAAHAAPAAKSDAAHQPVESGSEPVALRPETVGDPVSFSASVAGSSVTSVDKGSAATGDRNQGAAELRLEPSADVSSDEEGKTAGSAAIELHNEIVLTANGGADGAVPSPGSARDEMNDRMAEITSRHTDSLSDRLDVRLDEMRDRLDDFRIGGARETESGTRLDELRSRVDDLLDRDANKAGDQIALDAGLDGFRDRLDDFSGDAARIAREGGSHLDHVRDQFGALRPDPLTKNEDDMETNETINTFFQRMDDGGLAAVLDRSNDAVASERGEDGQAQIYGPTTTDPAAPDTGSSFLAALFDGDRAPAMDWDDGSGADRSGGSDGYLDPGEARDVNLVEGSAVSHLGEGSAFDPMDFHA